MPTMLFSSPHAHHYIASCVFKELVQSLLGQTCIVQWWQWLNDTVAVGSGVTICFTLSLTASRIDCHIFRHSCTSIHWHVQTLVRSFVRKSLHASYLIFDSRSNCWSHIYQACAHEGEGNESLVIVCACIAAFGKVPLMHLDRGSQAVAYRKVATRSGSGFVAVEYNRKNRWDLLVFVFTLIFFAITGCRYISQSAFGRPRHEGILSGQFYAWKGERIACPCWWCRVSI